mmetsp:Transcript_76181/g.137498  ORF Transcript_76181/g.137498 Transcript_76181/m.137498 type:complete len:97 (-) Transcript_76181:177-467(-)
MPAIVSPAKRQLAELVATLALPSESPLELGRQALPLAGQLAETQTAATATATACAELAAAATVAALLRLKLQLAGWKKSDAPPEVVAVRQLCCLPV